MSPALTINPMTTAYLFDLDGTLTSVELLPLIAREIGLEESMGELTRATMAGEIAFPESFSRRVAMLSHVPTKAVAEIVRSAPVHRQLLDWVLVHKEQCWVVTSNLDVWIEPWLQKYGLKGFSSTSRMTNGVISIDEILYKQDVLAHFDGFRTEPTMRRSFMRWISGSQMSSFILPRRSFSRWPTIWRARRSHCAGFWHGCDSCGGYGYPPRTQPA